MAKSDNTAQMSLKFKQLRLERIKKWQPRLKQTDYDFLFPIEKDFLDRINVELTEKGEKIFTPLKYPHNLDPSYHQYISYFIECLDFLPLKVDLAFDFSWKGLELYMGEAYEHATGKTMTNITDLIKYSVSNFWENKLKSEPAILATIDKLIVLMPAQSYEYLAKRILENYNPTNPLTDQVYKRIAMTNGNVVAKMDTFLRDIFTKYGNPNNGVITRKVGKLLYNLLQGQEISLPNHNDLSQTNKYTLSLKEKLDLILNGLIYTYRNERFHGNTFSPFKSSKASLRTYAHAHYLFLWSYILVNLTKLYINHLGLTGAQVEQNILANVTSFENLYGRHLKI